jgi:hypothetical protein
LTIGSHILEYLDKSNLAIKVAALVYLEDYDEWRFALASPRLASPQLEGRRHTDWYTKYLKQRGCLTQNPAAYNLGMKERFVRELRARYSKTEDTEGRRIDRQTLAIVTSKTVFCIASASGGLGH